MGRGLEALGASWVTFWHPFLVLLFVMLSKRALGGSWDRFWLDFEGSGEGFGLGFGRVLVIFQVFWKSLSAPKWTWVWERREIDGGNLIDVTSNFFGRKFSHV